MLRNPKVSVVVPSFNEEKNILRTAKVIRQVMKKVYCELEIIFVDDGSKDASWEKICEASKKYPEVRGVLFSRNFGKEAAIYAGLSECRGDCAVVIDCDLQHPPEKIIEMFEMWRQGYEIVEGVKSDRGDESHIHRFCARSFYKVISRAANIDMSRSSDFKLLDRKAILAILNIREQGAFFRALTSWVGFKTTEVEYDVAERFAGESKWSTKKLIRYAISNIASFTTIPMQLVSILGLVIFVATSVLSIVSIIQKINGTALGGFTTLIIMNGFTSSIIMLSLGVIGYYLSRIYDEVKARPRYVISEKTK